MAVIERAQRAAVGLHAAALLALADLGQAAQLLRARAGEIDWTDERGDVEARTITIAIMAALALSVGAIITLKVTQKANSISLDAPAGP